MNELGSLEDRDPARLHKFSLLNEIVFKTYVPYSYSRIA